MKQIFFLNDGKKKYNSKSISDYKKTLLMKAFEKTLMAKDLYNSLYFAFEIIASGYFKDFWVVVFTFVSEHTHILAPNLPKAVLERYEWFKNLEKRIKKKKLNILDMRNLLDFQKHVVFIVKNITNSKQKHASYFIKPSYNHQQSIVKNQRQILIMFKRFKLLLATAMNNKITYRGNTDSLLNELFNILGQIVAIDADSVNNMDYPYNLNLYHHTKSKLNDNVMEIFWNQILTKSRYNKHIWEQVTSLYKMYNYKLIYKLEKESYHILHAFFYFVYNIEDTQLLNITKGEMKFVGRFYTNIQQSLNIGRVRVDYLIIEDKKKKKKKAIQKARKQQNPKSYAKRVKEVNKRLLDPKIQNKNISKNNIRMYAVTPQAAIDKIIADNKNSVAKPINPNQIYNEVELKETLKPTEMVPEVYEDPLLQFIADAYESQQESGGSEIDIVIKGQDEDPEASMIDFFFNFENVATTDDMENKIQKPTHIEEIRKVSVSKVSYYGKSGPSKHRHRIVKV